MVTEHEEDKGEKAEGTQLKYYYRFRSRQKGAIDALIDKTYSWYIAELKKQEDNSRYLYEMQLNPSSKSGDDDGNASFKRYKLSDEAVLKPLLRREGETPRAAEALRQRTGKYAVQGYPHKFGLLLHGPPGTGKTSLIKALAQHTGRSIVNVPLARITTNQELMDIMFDQVTGRHRHHHLFSPPPPPPPPPLHHHHHLRNLLLPLSPVVMGDEVPIKLGFKDVIFVMEDVDAASKVVQPAMGSPAAAARVTTRCSSCPREGEPRRRRRADAVAAAALLVGRRHEGTRGGAHGQIVAAQGGGDRPGKRARGGGGPADAEAARRRMTGSAPNWRRSQRRSAVDAAQKVRAMIGRAGRRAHASSSPPRSPPSLQVHGLLNEQNDRREATESFVRGTAATLKRLLKAGGAVDTALEDELLGVAPPPTAAGARLPPTPSKVRRNKTGLGYDGGAAAGGGGKEEDEEEPVDMQTQMAMMMSMMTSGGGGGGGADAPAIVGPVSSASALKKDKLNLSGLLNVLDGVVDTPERIVVMTTNIQRSSTPRSSAPAASTRSCCWGT